MSTMPFCQGFSYELPRPPPPPRLFALLPLPLALLTTRGPGPPPPRGTEPALPAGPLPPAPLGLLRAFPPPSFLDQPGRFWGRSSEARARGGAAARWGARAAGCHTSGSWGRRRQGRRCTWQVQALTTSTSGNAHLKKTVHACARACMRACIWALCRPQCMVPDSSSGQITARPES